MWRASRRRRGGLRQLKDMARAFAEPWRSAVAWLRDGHPVWRVGLAEWDPGARGGGGMVGAQGSRWPAMRCIR